MSNIYTPHDPAVARVARSEVGGNTCRDREPFGALVLRAAAQAELLEAVLERVAGRISGGYGKPVASTEGFSAPQAPPPLDQIAMTTAFALERCSDLAQRIAGDVGAQG